MATQIGPKIGIEGEKEYRDALKQIINETKNLDAAMQKTASEWTANTSAMTKNKAIAQNLVQQIENQKEKLSIMNHMLEESAAKFGENAEATKSWQRAVDLTTASLNKMENELQEFHGAEGFSDISTKFADVGNTLQNIGAKMTAVGQKMSMAITLPLTAAGGAAVNLASNMEEASSKVDVIFGSMSESVKSFTETSLDSFGISNVKAMEMLGSFGALATQMGISDRAAAEMATTLTGLSGDLASFHNSEAEVAASALEGIFTGQTRALVQFAGAIRQTDLEEFAQKMGKSYSQMSEAEKVMARYQIVLERTKDAQGDYTRTSDGTANSIHTFKGAIEQLGVAFGEHILPVITPIINKLTELIKKFTELPPDVQKIIVIFALVAAVLGPIIIVLGAFVGAIGTITSALPGFIAGLTGAASAIVGFEVSLAPAIAILLAFGAAVIAASIAIGYIAANWGEITAGVSDMISGISSAIKKFDSFRSALADLAADMARSLLDKIKELPNKIAAELKEAIAKMKEIFNQMVADAKKSGKDMVDGFVDGIKSKVQKVIDAVKKIAQSVKDFLGFSEPDKGPLSDFHTFAPDMMKLFAQGINQNKGIVIKALDGLAKEIALPLDSGASMNVALAGADGSSMSVGGTTMNVYVDHIDDLQDLVRIQNQAQQRYRMGAR